MEKEEEEKPKKLSGFKTTMQVVFSHHTVSSYTMSWCMRFHGCSQKCFLKGGSSHLDHVRVDLGWASMENKATNSSLLHKFISYGKHLLISYDYFVYFKQDGVCSVKMSPQWSHIVCDHENSVGININNPSLKSQKPLLRRWRLSGQMMK